MGIMVASEKSPEPENIFHISTVTIYQIFCEALDSIMSDWKLYQISVFNPWGHIMSHNIMLSGKYCIMYVVSDA